MTLILILEGLEKDLDVLEPRRRQLLTLYGFLFPFLVCFFIRVLTLRPIQSLAHQTSAWLPQLFRLSMVLARRSVSRQFHPELTENNFLPISIQIDGFLAFPFFFFYLLCLLLLV